MIRPNWKTRDFINFCIAINAAETSFDPFLVLRNERLSRNQNKLRLLLSLIAEDPGIQKLE